MTTRELNSTKWDRIHYNAELMSAIQYIRMNEPPMTPKVADNIQSTAYPSGQVQEKPRINAVLYSMYLMMRRYRKVQPRVAPYVKTYHWWMDFQRTVANGQKLLMP